MGATPPGRAVARDPDLAGIKLETVDGTVDSVVDPVTAYERDTLEDGDLWGSSPTASS